MFDNRPGWPLLNFRGKCRVNTMLLSQKTRVMSAIAEPAAAAERNKKCVWEGAGDGG